MEDVRVLILVIVADVTETAQKTVLFHLQIYLSKWQN